MIAERIKELRQARGWTQADLARLFCVSTDYLLGVEPLNTVNVTGLDERDVAILAELADRLRQHKADE